MKKYIEKIKKYNFEFKHIAILFTVLIIFEIAMFFIFKGALASFIGNTQEWYQQYSSDRIVNYTANSFEMLIETLRLDEDITPTERKKMIQKFDILLNQQSVEPDIEEICLFVLVNNNFEIIDDGEILFNVLIDKNESVLPSKKRYKTAEKLFESVKNDLTNLESTQSIIDSNKVFHSFIPFLPDGEFVGVMYVKSKPNFTLVTKEFIFNYDDIAFVISILILTGMFMMYLISSKTVKTRDKAQHDLYLEKNEHMKEKLNHEKEFIFTKRIYHAHHKAEKIIGFINSDLNLLKGDTEIVKRVSKYSNYIARIIYDMKWYEPQISTIRNPMFNTNLNEVIKFIVNNVFLRLSINSAAFTIQTEFDEKFPNVNVNEFVIWELIEPLIQNSISHNPDLTLTIIIKTFFDKANRKGLVAIEDNGKGIEKDLLETENNVKRIFLENTSTKQGANKNYGYGCFIAYNMVKRCGWNLDVENLSQGGCRFLINIQF